MFGEVDANDILNTKQWIASTLVLIFEVITILILMNLMLSVAVDDVKELMEEAEGEILKIKVKFLIEVLQIIEESEKEIKKYCCTRAVVDFLKKKCACLNVTFHTTPPKNVLVVDNDRKYGFFEGDFEKKDWDEEISNEITAGWFTSCSDFWTSLKKWLIGLNLNQYLKNYSAPKKDSPFFELFYV